MTTSQKFATDLKQNNETMANELTGLLEGGAQLLSSWLPAGLRTSLDEGAHLMTSWFETNQLT